MIEFVRALNNFNADGFIPLTHNGDVIGYINRHFLDFVQIAPFAVTESAVVYKHSTVEDDSVMINSHFKALKDNSRTPSELRDELSGWRNEEYGVYSSTNQLLFRLERAAAGILGIPTYGIHVNGHTPTYNLWIPRRARTKQTYPGMLDNTVAGGIAFGDSVLHTVMKECAEEANLEHEVIRSSLKSAGVVTYFYMKNDLFAQPEIQFIFDLLLDEIVTPAPNDGEVEAFYKMTVEQATQYLQDHQFKPNCALVLIDFFVRHGFISPDADEYIELNQNMHRVLPLSNIFTPRQIKVT